MLCLLDNSWLWYLYTYSTSNGPQNLAFGHLLEIPIPIYTVNHIHKYYTVHITWYKNSRITWYLQVYRCTCCIFLFYCTWICPGFIDSVLHLSVSRTARFVIVSVFRCRCVTCHCGGVSVLTALQVNETWLPFHVMFPPHCEEH